MQKQILLQSSHEMLKPFSSLVIVELWLKSLHISHRLYTQHVLTFRRQPGIVEKG